MNIDQQEIDCGTASRLLVLRARAFGTRPASLTAVGCLRRAVRVAIFALLICSGMALGAEAEMAEAAAEGAGWLPVACTLGGSALTGSGVWVWSKLHRVQIEPQPLEVREAKEYATRAELEDLRNSVSKDMRAIAENITKAAISTAEIKGSLGAIAVNQQQILTLLLNRDHRPPYNPATPSA